MLFVRHVERLRRAVHIVRVHRHTGGAVVVHLHHLAFVQRQHQCLAFLEAAARNRIPTLSFQFVTALEQSGVVGHVEHRAVAHRIQALFARDLVRVERFFLRDRIGHFGKLVPHQHRMRAVDARGELRVERVAENRRGAGIRIHRAKIVGGQRDHPRGAQPRGCVGVIGQFGRREFGHGVQIERAACDGKLAAHAAENQRAEFEARMDVRKENFLVLEVDQRRQPAGGGDRTEEPRRALVGRDTRGCKQADDAIWFHQM